MPNNCLTVLYKHVIQVENKNLGLKVGEGTNIPLPPNKKSVCGGGGGAHAPPPPLPTPVLCIVYYLYLLSLYSNLLILKDLHTI